MRTTDLFNFNRSSKRLNESLHKTFGTRIDFESFDTPKLEDARNKLRTQIHTARTSSGFNETVENEALTKAQFMHDAIVAELADRQEHIVDTTVEEGNFDEEELSDVLKAFDENMNERGAYGEPDYEKIIAALDNQDIESAIDIVWDAYSDQDGGEIDMYDAINDLEDEFKYLVHSNPVGRFRPSKESVEDDGSYADGSSVKTPGGDDWKDQYQQAVMAVKNAKTQQEYEAASDRADRIKDLLASKGIKVGPVLGQSESAPPTAKGERMVKHIKKGYADDGKLTDKEKSIAYATAWKAHNKNESIEQTGDDMRNLREGEIQQASAIVTAKTMVDRVGRWIEELSGMENDTLLQLGDSIRDEMGQEQAKAFIEAVAPAIQQALENLKTTRDTLSTGVRSLATGEQPDEMLGAEPEMGMGDEGGMDMAEPDMMNEPEMGDEEDAFSAAEPGAGGMETTGREQRESIDRQSRLMKILAG
jgi:hypothetical protein